MDDSVNSIERTWAKTTVPGSMEPKVTLDLTGLGVPAEELGTPACVSQFKPGDVIDNRFVVVRFIARGGMGEVFEVEDRQLREIRVALKTILSQYAVDPVMRQRFEREVLSAREVVHPNLCPIYDLGHWNRPGGAVTYLTMKLLPGESLAAKISRAGPLPSEEVLCLMRQVGAGIAAAHDAGILHRDIKSANIILQGAGTEVHAWVTDFGLARALLSDETVLTVQGVAGTPGFMAPEIFHGDAPSKASDIYALGVVAYQALTGRLPQMSLLVGKEGASSFRASEIPKPWRHFVEGCLKPSVEERFKSVPEAMQALPSNAGQNDEAEPLAGTGEVIPLTKFVAGAGSDVAMSVPVAITCLAIVLAGIAGLCFLRQRTSIVNQIPMENSSEVLAAKARDIAKSLGYTERPVDTSFGWDYNEDYLRYVGGGKSFTAQGRNFSAQHPPAVFFWLRESPHYLVNYASINAPKRFERDTLEPGMLDVLLDSEGRLIDFQALPQQAEDSTNGQKPEFDWVRLFIAAGLDPSRFTRVPPMIHPLGAYDSQAAWMGSWETNPKDLLRVETGAYLSQPVFFRIIGPWTRADEHPYWSAGVISFATFLFFLVLLPIGAGLLAWRNARLGRADQQGAFRLAVSAFLCMFLGSIVGNNHVPTSAEITTLFSALRDAFVTGAIFWVVYMAAEPVVRRRSPATLIAWNRLLEGRLRDPRIGRELLAGFVLGVVGAYVLDLVPIPFIETLAPRLAPGLGAFFSLWCWFTIVAVCIGLSNAFVLNVLLQLIRSQWLAMSIFVIAMTIVFTAGGPLITALRGLLLLLMAVYTLMRFGVLAEVALLYVHNVQSSFPLTTNPSTWFAPAVMLAIGSVVALAIYAFLLALPGRKLLKVSLENL
jgi:serine/threonine protein kinase